MYRNELCFVFFYSVYYNFNDVYNLLLMLVFLVRKCGESGCCVCFVYSVFFGVWYIVGF